MNAVDTFQNLPAWAQLTLQMGVACWAQSALILLLGLALVSALRKFDPKLRSNVLRVAFIAAFVFPLVAGILVPFPKAAIRLSFPPPWKSAHTAPVLPTTIPGDVFNVSFVHNNQTDFETDQVTGLPGLRQILSTRATPIIVALPLKPARWSIAAYVYVILLILGIGESAFLLVRLWSCYRHVKRIARVPEEDEPAAPFEKLAEELAIELDTYLPELRISSAVRSPMLIGVRRPVIILPASITRECGHAELSSILVHELIHLKRRDCLWLYMIQPICALAWAQPLFWIAATRLEDLSEEVCDSEVVSQLGNPKRYANLLLSVAERWLPAREETLVGAGLLPFKTMLARRIEQILSTPTWPRMSTASAIALGVVGCVVTGLTSYAFSGATGAPATSFTWAKQQGWDVRPVKRIYGDVPTQYLRATTDENWQLTSQCYRAGILRSLYKPSQTPPKVLTRILASHPHFYYGEYLLAAWYRCHGNPDKYLEYFGNSLHDAPHVLAGRWLMENGRPAAGFEFAPQIEFAVPKGSRPDARDLMGYPVVITDAEGCYYIPIADGAISMGYILGWPSQIQALYGGPAHYTNSYPLSKVGPFATFVSRVGTIHDLILYPHIPVAFHGLRGTGTFNDPLILPGRRLSLKWPQYYAADHYQVTISGITADSKSPNGYQATGYLCNVSTIGGIPANVARGYDIQIDNGRFKWSANIPYPESIKSGNRYSARVFAYNDNDLKWTWPTSEDIVFEAQN